MPFGGNCGEFQLYAFFRPGAAFLTSCLLQRRIKRARA